MLELGKYIGVGHWDSSSFKLLEPLEVTFEISGVPKSFTVWGSHRRHVGQGSTRFDLQVQLAGPGIFRVAGTYDGVTVTGTFCEQEGSAISALQVGDWGHVAASLEPIDNGRVLRLLANQPDDAKYAELRVYREDVTVARSNVVEIKGESS